MRVTKTTDGILVDVSQTVYHDPNSFLPSITSSYDVESMSAMALDMSRMNGNQKVTVTDFRSVTIIVGPPEVHIELAQGGSTDEQAK